jgi:hypothetical protein
MKNTFQQQETDIKSPIVFHAILFWLVRLVLLTEEEQNDAGIYFGRQYDDDQNT